ncbi:MAG TPA: GAF domain-containing protein [Cyanobacteria bacterium UBA11371]|nr:GAF domain-containing protein [Cyanobacteria bacterium UBA11371]
MDRTRVEDIQVNLDRESLLCRVTNRIRRSLELQEILAATVTEVREFLRSDRVKIYKFNPDGSGLVIAESIQDNRLPSLLGLNFPADDIPPQARELFVQARVRSIVDVDSRQIGQSQQQDLETGEILFEDIRYRPVDPCHAEYLTAMGVKSSVVVPILHQDRLWGLLVSHHSEARAISEAELQGVQQVVDQLGVAIAQSSLLTQARECASREATVHRITTLLHSLPTIELLKALEETVAAFGGSGGRLCTKALAFSSLAECLEAGPEHVNIYTCGNQPQIPAQVKYPLLEQYSVWKEGYKSEEYDVWAISDIYQTPLLRNLQVAFRLTPIRSLLMIPIHYRQQLIGYLSIFRDQIDTETLWAGQFDQDARQLYPRRSFEVWRQTKSAQAREWTEEEIELARALSKQFATAIYQYELYQQVLEQAAKLQQSKEHQEALFGVVTKIRASLDVNTIFPTTTKEVCQLLKVDRVAVYRFNADWGGEFVSDFEFTNPGEGSLIQQGIKTVWNDTHLQETQGGRYRNGESFAVDDIYQVGHSPCHIEVLEQFRIKAYIIAPIFVGQTLWGLLAAYQHFEPRHWETREIEFMTKTAIHLGVALQQAELHAQTKQQAQQVAVALKDLQNTQAQLIQTEKMSSLGQLVAGVAHEINNPVNFIYGNITHAKQYSDDLLHLLKLYQQQSPNPSGEISNFAEAIDLEFIVDDLPKILTSMAIGADRIRQLVLSLRNFSRLDEAEMKPVNIHDGIESTLLILQPRLKAKSDGFSIELIKDYGDLPPVECYAGQMNQVFTNVLSNGIDALEQFYAEEKTTDTPKIRIQTCVVGEKAVIRISDNGPGMPEAVKDKIFDPFFTTKPVGKGTGLGLSICYKIVVEKHGGVFKCTSAPGRGTEFSIEIPIQQMGDSIYSYCSISQGGNEASVPGLTQVEAITFVSS